ncbi:hypothetical protein BC830DRAFT_1171382 [Chytriomyces sp. MP71]|nr:hypothetical protein BC830DRAFT_1171382 [Chytriomyces sp. MP71]
MDTTATREATSQAVRHLSLLLKRSVPPQFVSEARVLDRLVYKNRNQHRSAKHFSHALKVRRIVKRLLGAHLHGAVKTLLASMNVGNPKKFKPSSNDTKPDVVHFKALLEALTYNHSLLSLLADASLAAYLSLKQVASLSYFIPMCLTLMAVCARLRHYSALIKKDLEEAYTILRVFGSRVCAFDLEAFHDAIDDTSREKKLAQEFDLFDHQDGETDRSETRYSEAEDERAFPLLPLQPAECLASDLDFFSSRTTANVIHESDGNVVGKTSADVKKRKVQTPVVESTTKKVARVSYTPLIKGNSSKKLGERPASFPQKSRPQNQRKKATSGKQSGGSEIDDIFGF